MRRHAFFVLVGLLGFGLALFPAMSGEKQKKEAPKPEAKAPEKIDLTGEVQAMNSDKFEAPPKEFRKGKVTPRKLDANAIKFTDKGFTIQLPSKAPIATPTVYKGKIYVSGGFQSREFYCFDAATGKLVWAVDLDDDGPSSAVCEDDVCIFNTESCTIFALDAKTGKHIWSYFLGDPLTSTPTIANGKVFTSYPAGGNAGPAEGLNQAPSGPVAKNSGPTGKDKKDAKDKSEEKAKELTKPPQIARPNASHVLACFDLKTGNILWQRWIDSDVMSAPVATLGDVYATSFAGTVYRFSQDKGTILSAQRSRATSAPVVVGGNVYITKRADDGKGGKVQEQIQSVNRMLSGPQYSTTPKDALYLDEGVQAKSDLDKLGKKLDAGNGFGGGAPATANPKAAAGNVGQANVSTMQAFQGSRILHFQNSNYNCMGNEICCSDPATGKLQWSVKLAGDLEKLGGFLASPPAAAGGFLFLATVQGDVLRVDPDKGKILETYKVGSPIRAQPAIEGGRIYVGTQDGKVVCINTGNPQFTGWTTWGANSAHTNVVEKNAAAK